MPTYDSPWKEALYHHLRLLLLLLFPRLAARINWAKDYQPLEQELRKLSPEGEVGTRFADALIRVRLLSGDDRILHAEVQAQKDDEFAGRVYLYNYRARDLWLTQPESLVILADEDRDWVPTEYHAEHDYSGLAFRFRPVKLVTEWGHRREELRTHDNPMGLFVLAHLEAQRTEGDEPERIAVKLGLLLNLAARKLDPDDDRLFFRYLDWLLPLPPEVNREVFAQARAKAKENLMPFVSIAEIVGREEGEVIGQTKGLLIGLRSVLRLRFTTDGEALMPALEKIDDPRRLEALLALAERASIDDIRAALAP